MNSYRFTFLRPLFVILLTVFMAQSLYSQKTDYIKTYTEAKNELKNKNFQKAMDLFKKAAVDKPENAYKVNAMYFHAYCSFKLKMYWSVNHYLNKIIEKYPEWYKIDEVYYLLAQTSYDKKEYSQAMAHTQKIKSKFFKTDVANTEWNYFYFPSLQDTVAFLQKKYPNDTTLANIYYCLIKDVDERKVKKIAKSLKEDYRLGVEEKKEPEKKAEAPKTETTAAVPPVPKDTLNIAVVLPFNLPNNIQENTIKEDMYVYDLYSGIRTAYDSLRRAGAKIRLVAYDYGKDSIGYVNLMRQEELKQYDIVIGPLQNSLGDRASLFADSSNTMVINPLSYNSKFIEDSNHVFLFKASTETQTREAATFAYSYFKPKKAIIFSSKLAKDSLAALSFQQTFEKAGGKILTKQTLTAGNLPKLNSIFTPKTLDSTGFIFVSTKDQYLAGSIVRKLTELNKTTPLLVFSDWLDFQSMTFDQMQKQNIYFIEPDFVNKGTKATKTITNYLESYTYGISSDYTYAGYELIWQLGQLWKTKENLKMPIFLKGLPYRPGLIYDGIDYSKSNDNKCSSVYYFAPEGFREAKMSP